MAEIVIAVVAKVAEYLVVPIARPFVYMWNYKSNLSSLKTEVQKLEATKGSVLQRIEAGKEALPIVTNWQQRVDQIIGEASTVAEDNPEQVNMQCCKAFTCPNLKKRYQQSKDAARKLKDVVELEQEGREFTEVSTSTIPEETWLQSSKGYQAFESRTSILKDIIDAFYIPDVNMIGIYGMGGVGKTTLAKQVAQQGEQDKLFDKIISVELSETAVIKDIQEEIGVKLGLKFYRMTDNGRAGTLFKHLKEEINSKEKKILLIFDNIWEMIDLEKVGIPIGSDCKGLKLLLTTRNLHLLTNEMDCQCNFPINALNEEDAWSLFRSNAGSCVEQSHMESTAREVAKECGGMPVAIVTIARALKNKEECEWKSALQELRNPSPYNFEGVAKKVYTTIKLSYDYLENDELKKIFLLCSCMGPTNDASIHDLFNYGFGLGFIDRFNNMEDALCSVHTWVSKLKTSSLLLDAAPESKRFYSSGFSLDSERFAIHDVVCDIARSIANVAIPQNWKNEVTLRNCTSITLHNIGELPEDPLLVCPKLKFLYVKPNDSSMKIPNNFFLGMSGLQVLHLIKFSLRPLPTSLNCLVNLQTLCLEYCELGDIDVVGDFKKLKVLSFRGSQIVKLSEQMCHLDMLRLLDLTNCFVISVIPPRVLSSLTKLEALYMRNACIRSKFSFDQLGRLPHLTMLAIHIPDAILSKGLPFERLERYNIIIGNDRMMFDIWSRPFTTNRNLTLDLESDEDGSIWELKGIRELNLAEVPGARNLLEDFDNDFRELKHLHVVENSHCLCIVDSKQLVSLESLLLRGLKGLENICKSPLKANSFVQLRSIGVRQCHKLNNIFSFSTKRVLPKLEEITVFECENMEEIFAIGGQEQDDANNNQIELIQLRKLELRLLPRLKSFCCNEVDIPTLLFNDKVVFPKLETLNVDGINVGIIWDNQLPTISCVQNLTSLIITDLANLRRLWSGNLIEFPILKEITIERCPKLEEFIFDNKVRVPNLEKLKIFEMDNLEMIWHNQLADDDFFSKLKSLEVDNCNKLLIVFPSSMCGRISSLETLSVRGCRSLEKIFILQGINFEGHSTIVNLQTLEVSYCESLKNLFIAKEDAPAVVKFLFPKLTFVKLNELPNLRTFYPGSYTMEGFVLKSLQLSACGIEESVFGEEVWNLFVTGPSLALFLSQKNPIMLLDIF